MTAEVAILNKSAVALAADSALSIKHQNGTPKIYNSEHKLFELSLKDPLGIMVSDDMSFLEIPIPVIVFDYREHREKFDRFHRAIDAADDFRKYLHALAKVAPADVQSRQLIGHVKSDLKELNQAIQESSQAAVLNFLSKAKRQNSKRSSSTSINAAELVIDAITEQIDTFKLRLSARPVASLIGKEIVITRRDRNIIKALIKEHVDRAFIRNRFDDKILNIIVDHLGRIDPAKAATGIVIAGFGKDDIFPTLVSFDLHGFIGGCLRYTINEEVDIDRQGTRARVMPFAQKEMVQRVMRGVDDPTFEQMTLTFEQLLANQRKTLLKEITLSPGDRKKIGTRAAKAEVAIFTDAIASMREEMVEKSRREIDSMVEFMPKSELAEMAEALVNITLIKGRVSNVVETVGGPIDVAVISRSEGFVWVKHKHYFPAGLNPGFYRRNNLALPREFSNAQKDKKRA